MLDFICAVVFIRWPGILFSQHTSSDVYVGPWSGQLRQSRALSALLFTGAMLLICLIYFPQYHSETSKPRTCPFSLSHCERMLGLHPLHRMGKKCCTSIVHNSALQAPTETRTSANISIRFSMCGRNLILLQLPQVINALTPVIIYVRLCGERWSLIRDIWNKLRDFQPLLCFSTGTILFRSQEQQQHGWGEQ